MKKYAAFLRQSIQKLIKHLKKHRWRYSLGIPVVLIGIIVISDIVVSKVSRKYLYSSVDDIPHNKVGLLLGTAKTLPNGNINLYYQYRINAAVALYRAGKIDYILVSGDNSTRYYNEPAAMKNDLIKRGIPARKIYLDYAGFRTLDSVVRSKEIFGQTDITVISQAFHNERAVFIARVKNINAYGFNAQAVTTYSGIKTMIREKLARVKMFLDLLVGKKPKFSGEKIRIGVHTPQ